MSHRAFSASLFAAVSCASLMLASCSDDPPAPDGGVVSAEAGIPDVVYLIPDATVIRPDAAFLLHDAGGDQSCSETCDCPQGLGCVNGTCRQLANPVYCCAKRGCPTGAACLDRGERPSSCEAPDAGVDGGATDVGHGLSAPCGSDLECDPGLTCLAEDEQPFLWEGYCSVSPCVGLVCPQSSLCITFGTAIGSPSACMLQCVSNGDCHPGDYCFTIPNSSVSFCYPDCHDDFVDCRPWDGLTYCSRASGQCEATPSNNAAAQIGDPCLDTTDCAMGDVCLGEYFWMLPGGSCSKLCQGGPEATPCDTDELCVFVDQNQTIGVCFPRCVGGTCPNRPNAVCTAGDFCLPQ